MASDTRRFNARPSAVSFWTSKRDEYDASDGDGGPGAVGIVVDGTPRSLVGSRINSVLYSPMTVSGRAMSNESRTDPIDDPLNPGREPA